METDNQVEIKNPLVKVSCNACGEQFTLRGTMDPDGTVTAGVKMCFCGSTDMVQTVLD